MDGSVAGDFFGDVVMPKDRKTASAPDENVGAAVAPAPAANKRGSSENRPGMSEETKVRGRGGALAAAVPSRRRFEIYKRGQGYYTRMGTVVGGAIILLAGMNYLWDQLGVIYDASKIWSLYLRVGIPLAFGIGLGLILFWVTGSSRKCCDFFIATEGEMKKVSWSTKREVVGSTKVVILFTILLAIMLFVVDVVFLLFFSWIQVVKVRPEVLRRIFQGIFGLD